MGIAMLAAHFAVLRKREKVKRVLIGILAVVGLHSAAMAAGAIAASWGDDRFFVGLVVDLEPGFAVGKAALKECQKDGGTACEVRLRFEDTCAAAAMGSHHNGMPVAASAIHSDEQEAIKNAIANCERDDANCSKYASGCDSDKFVAEEDSATNSGVPANAGDCAQFVGEVERTRKIDGLDDQEGVTVDQMGKRYQNICSVAIRGKWHIVETFHSGSVSDNVWWWRRDINPDQTFEPGTLTTTGLESGETRREVIKYVDYCYPEIEGGNNPDPCPPEALQ